MPWGGSAGEKRVLRAGEGEGVSGGCSSSVAFGGGDAMGGNSPDDVMLFVSSSALRDQRQRRRRVRDILTLINTRAKWKGGESDGHTISAVPPAASSVPLPAAVPASSSRPRESPAHRHFISSHS